MNKTKKIAQWLAEHDRATDAIRGFMMLSGLLLLAYVDWRIAFGVTFVVVSAFGYFVKGISEVNK